MKTIILFGSEAMDSNRKEGRQEGALIRFSENVRNNLKLDINDQIHLINDDNVYDKQVYKAFSKDIKKVESYIKEGLVPAALINYIGFVTTNTIRRLGGNNNRLITSMTKQFDDFLIGTDPELLLFNDTNNVVAASSIMGLRKDTPFGADGAMAELRPKPSFTQKGLVANMQQVLLKYREHPVNAYHWKSACYYIDEQRDYPVGTHIHFDNLGDIKRMPSSRKARLFAVTNKIVDELLTLPMIRLDGSSGYNRRAHCKMSVAGGFGNQFGKGYGYYGEWRVCNGHLEHRSLSGLAISNPTLAENVYGTAKAIVEAVYRKALEEKLNTTFILPEKFDTKIIYNKKFDSWSEIGLAKTFDCTNSSDLMTTIMDNSSRVEISKEYVRRWLERMRDFPTYGKYEHSIEGLGVFLASSAKALKSINTNLKQTWE